MDNDNIIKASLKIDMEECKTEFMAIRTLENMLSTIKDSLREAIYEYFKEKK